MSLRPLMPVALGLAFVTPALLCAQTQPTAQVQNGPVGQQVGGKMSVDLIILKADQLGVPLRHSGLIPNSEEVSLNGHKLRQGQDYNVDPDSGMIYLMVPYKPGQSVSVSYRYDASRAPASGSAPASTFAPFRLDFGQGGGMSMMLGMGLAERTSDGNVLTSNIFGWNNAFNLGGSAMLSGLMLYGQRSQQQTQSSFEYQGNTKAADQGKSRLIMQTLGSNLGGGSVKFDFQDVSKNFTGFSAVGANGYDQSVADRLSKERGLKRMGFSMDKVQLGALGFNESYRTVGNEKGGIKWENYGLNFGGVSLNYKSQAVGQHFDRFADLAEGDRDQLARETGITRKGLDAAWKTNFGALSFSNSSIDETTNGKGINRRDMKFSSTKLNFDMGSQTVQMGFDRFGSLNDAEQPQWSRESGLTRHWLSLDTLAFGATSPLKFSQYQIDSTSGQMANMDASLVSKGWSIEHIERNVDKGFSALPNLKQDEINANITAISSMYAKGGLPLDGSSQPQYLASAGLSRDFNRICYTPTPKFSLDLESLALTGQNDKAGLKTFSLNAGNTSFSYRDQNLGKNFNELNRLMPFEQQRLGTIIGLSRTDLNFNTKLSAKTSISFNQTNADSPTGGFARQGLAYADPKLQFHVNSRNVDPGFNAVGSMLDPEAATLATMIGYRETDAAIKWQLFPNLRLEASSWDGFNHSLNQRRASNNLLVDWKPTKSTSLVFQKNSADPNNPLQLLLQNMMQRLSFSQDFGKEGILSYNSQQINYGGSDSAIPDSKLTDLSYERKLSSTTSFKTQQTNTTFANGDTQKISANTISTEITKRAGVSLTDVSIAGTGGQKDEHKHNVGFWMNLWGNVKLNFGIADDLNQLGSSTTQHNLSLTPGSVGNMNIGAANYAANTWEQGNRTQALSQITLSTVKPFNFGVLRDLKLSLGQDTSADNGAWLKENKSIGLGGKIGKNSFSYNFFSQMNNLQQRGVDRSFAFATDQSETAPLRMNLSYKFRTLPGDKNIAIRNFSVTARPMKGMELTNEVVTNPENPAGDQLLGSLPLPLRANKWKLDYLRDPNFKVQGSWQEQRDDSTNMVSRLGGMTFTMFEKSGSPVSIFLGVEQAGGNVPNHVTNRWSLRWDQKPGPNQALSLFIGNITYGGTIAPGTKSHNLSVDFQYQFKF